MSTAEEAEQERRVFEDDDDDDDDDVASSDTDDSEDDEDDADGKAALPHPSPQLEAAQPALAAVGSGYLNPDVPSQASTSPCPSSAPTLNPILSERATSPPQNGAIPVPVLQAVTPSGESLFTSTTSVFVPIATASASAAVVAMDDSRRLFQRLWTDDEEIKILQEFYEFTSRRGTTFASHQYDTRPFYEEVKKQLQFEFTKNQLIEKLRRLKKKYRNCVSRMQSLGKDFAFKSVHEQTIYDISCKIWSASTKRAHESDDEDLKPPNTIISNEIITVSINDGSLSSGRRIPRSRRRRTGRILEETATADAPVAVERVIDNSTPVMQPASTAGLPNIIEESVKSCLSPLFKELINSIVGGVRGPIGSVTSPMNLLPLCLGGGSLAVPEMPVDEKWRKQQILELEVYLKRVEVVRDHVKSILEELKTAGS